MLVLKSSLTRYQQRGSALIVSLVFLLLLTMLGLGAMKASVLQERMAGNMRDTNLAFQAAESALRAGENILQQNALPTFDNSVAGYRKQIDKMTGDYWSKTYAWDDTPATAGGSQQFSGTLDGLAQMPRFVIEELNSVDVSGSARFGAKNSKFTYYRITARGAGQSPDTVVILQSTFKISH